MLHGSNVWWKGGMREKEKYEMITLLQQVLRQPTDAGAQHHSWPLELLSGSSGLEVAWTIEIFQCRND